MDTLKRDSWHMKRYLWWHSNKYKNSQYGWQSRNIPNFISLCPYVRVVLLWYTLRQMFNDTTKKTIVSILFVAGLLEILVYKLLGLDTVLRADGIVLLGGIVVGILLGICAFADNLNHKHKVWRYNHPKEEKLEPSFWELLKEYLGSFHKRICPVYQIEAEVKQKENT